MTQRRKLTRATVFALTRRQLLQSFTLADLAERAAVGAGPMWYI